jgi:hypothetical protein
MQTFACAPRCSKSSVNKSVQRFTSHFIAILIAAQNGT